MGVVFAEPSHYSVCLCRSHLADVSVWINVAKAVTGLTITRALDANGQAIDPVAETTDGIVSRPVPFTCMVAPRSEQIMQLVVEATANAP